MREIQKNAYPFSPLLREKKKGKEQQSPFPKKIRNPNAT
jgi:hypothetical protein